MRVKLYYENLPSKEYMSVNGYHGFELHGKPNKNISICLNTIVNRE